MESLCGSLLMALGDRSKFFQTLLHSQDDTRFFSISHPISSRYRAYLKFISGTLFAFNGAMKVVDSSGGGGGGGEGHTGSS